ASSDAPRVSSSASDPSGRTREPDGAAAAAKVTARAWAGAARAGQSERSAAGAARRPCASAGTATVRPAAAISAAAVKDGIRVVRRIDQGPLCDDEGAFMGGGPARGQLLR